MTQRSPFDVLARERIGNRCQLAGRAGRLLSMCNDGLVGTPSTLMERVPADPKSCTSRSPRDSAFSHFRNGLRRWWRREWKHHVLFDRLTFTMNGMEAGWGSLASPVKGMEVSVSV